LCRRRPYSFYLCGWPCRALAISMDSVAVREVGGGNQVTKTEEPVWGGAANVGAVVIVLTHIVQVVVGKAPGRHVELGSEEEVLLHPARVQALQDLFGLLRAGKVRVCVQDHVHVVGHGPDI
jgi:hypothetical protein